MRIGQAVAGIALVASTAVGSGAQVFAGYNFQLNGSGGGGTPQITGGVLQLMNDQYGSATSAFTTSTFDFSAATAFTVSLQLHYAYTSAAGGIGDVIGDGIAFVMQGGDATALGIGGGGMGYTGMPNSFAVSFRSYWTDLLYGHDGNEAAGVIRSPAPFGASSTDPDLLINVAIGYDGLGMMAVAYSTSRGDVFFSPEFAVDLSSLGSTVRFGFTSGSGGATQLAEVNDVAVDGLRETVATPEPATIGLVATGVIGLGTFAKRRRRA